MLSGPKNGRMLHGLDLDGIVFISPQKDNRESLYTRRIVAKGAV